MLPIDLQDHATEDFSSDRRDNVRFELSRQITIVSQLDVDIIRLLHSIKDKSKKIEIHKFLTALSTDYSGSTPPN